jgi:hypothetical protein
LLFAAITRRRNDVTATADGRLNKVAAAGLAVGAILGMAGTFVSQPNLQNTCWAIDSVGLIIATTLLAIKFVRRGNDFLAAGFLVFAIGESVIFSGTAAGLTGSVPAFAAGAALWAAALLLISIPRAFAIWIRVVGVIAAALFALTAVKIFCGEQLLPTSSPLPFFAYPLLVLTLLGWMWTLLREGG